MRIERDGDQLLVRIPNGVAEIRSLQEGDEVDIYVITPMSSEPLDVVARAESIERIRALAVPLPPDWKSYLRQLRGD